MKYQPIIDLPSPEEVLILKSTELESLSALWTEKKADLENSGEFQQFIKKMQREWAIETGIIERLYTWDRGVTEVLIEQGVDSSIINHSGGLGRDEAENVAKLIRDQENIVESLFSFVKGVQPFSEHYIRSMHMEFTAHQDFTEAVTPEGKMVQIPLLKGEYKKQLNNPRRPDGEMHEYCPPEFVNDEMEKLVNIYINNEESVPPEILSAWLHHRFTQIHPFQDGNGRIARAIASLVFLKKGLFPLVIRESDRKEYITALEQADNGSMTALVKLFSKRQRDSILSALGIQQQVEQAKHSEQIISSTLALLVAKSTAKQEALSSIYEVAKSLQCIAKEKLTALQETLDPDLRVIETHGRDTFNASVRHAKDGEKESHYYQKQIYEVANKHDYFANLDRYKSWSRLVIYTDKIFELVFSIHGHGHGDNGVMVATGFTFEKIPSEDSNSGTEPTNTKPCSQEIFQFNYLESKDDTVKRFHEWVDDSITIALAEWQQTIT
jgi:Fic family protein